MADGARHIYNRQCLSFLSALLNLGSFPFLFYCLPTKGNAKGFIQAQKYQYQNNK